LNNHWRIPAAWKAIIKDNKINHWQVYADNIIVMEIIKRNKKKRLIILGLTFGMSLIQIGIAKRIG
jgi:hypothetical protein